jgi:long-chain-acyl-CoA dehydrogenase
MSILNATWVDEELRILHDSALRFTQAEFEPHREAWERQGMCDRQAWCAAGEAGLLCASIPEAYGGAGGNYFHEAIIYDAMMRGGAGSDLQGVKTTAVRDGDHYLINGSKTFISNGQHAELIVLVCKTGPAAGARGTSLVIVETHELEGFSRGRNLEKIGLKEADTSELFFNDTRVPTDNLLGEEEGQGFIQLMKQLPQERLSIACAGATIAEMAVEETIKYTKERGAFGKTVFDFQNTRFKLAECKTEATIARVFVDQCISKHVGGELSAEEASMAKWWCSQKQCDIVDECLQLHGGYGYMWEYPIARMYADSRVQKIYGGTNEIMKELISRSL